MEKEWTDYFRHICAMHSGEIAERLKDMKCEDKEEKSYRFAEQASLVVLKHFSNLLRETGYIEAAQSKCARE